MTTYPYFAKSACPHDCPSTCALEVEVVAPDRIGKVKGARDQAYTAGVVCAKVARYAERAHSEERLTKPLRRVGPKGGGQWQEISWDEALDEVASKFLSAEEYYGSESIWPYFFAGTMGLVQRDGIERLRHVKRYSGQYSTICVNTAWPGYLAGTGRLAGPDPREMALSDCVVIWGTNPVHTQVNVMTHAVKARKNRDAKIVVIDIYKTASMEQADLGLVLKPGTDGALACAVMHCLFRDRKADRDYLAANTDCPNELEMHLASRTPEWAAEITGLSVEEIEAFASLLAERPRSYFRLGYGFSRQRNGAVNMHAASCIAAVLGSWKYEGGGAFHSNSGLYKTNTSLLEATDKRHPSIRKLDQSQIGRVLSGDTEALQGGAPVKAMLIQNTNPLSVAPEQDLVRAGFEREDLFVCVHEQFMTETAEMADIVLPATMFTEHDDVYKGGGHQYWSFGPKLVEAPGECRPNHWVICELAKRLGAEHSGFAMDEKDHITAILKDGGQTSLNELEEKGWVDVQSDFKTAHYEDGFAWPDGKFRFRPKWKEVRFSHNGKMGPFDDLPSLPDHWDVIEKADGAHPFRLATSPARSFLNSTFSDVLSSRKKEGAPSLKIHSQDMAELSLEEGEEVRIGNERGETYLPVEAFDGLCRGVVIAEGIWRNKDHKEGRGINSLTSADQVAPFGGVAFHDNKVWIKKQK
ncbi:molybdopterin-dependent oxidoreductase [Cohaesibacter gelatinilyticus]|uniref:Anaerobic selenocysteine-containing dehydrogenase n=1 Tax=Cohaesibacter gelatinilyticus TaxID=372072 RepID=A0A285NFI3_9HYPH|nr:molybdopterin-dependent oxidoreductase [Cohaesibacter gelatinilyticus]SNZ08038.1 Anaerobic selenocysteine-containing dehydrogenase [Cohaesibacter gelatinilyticus]